MDSRDGIFGSACSQLAIGPCSFQLTGTYTLVCKSLYNCECSRIVYILHNKPVDCLFVFAVYSSCFDELGLDAVDGVGLVVCVEVDGECVDHGRQLEYRI